jgi:hypothetical protein
MKPLLIGELNPYGDDDHFALYPRPERASGHRLCTLVMGLREHDCLERFDRANLCYRKWSLPAARERAKTLLSDPGRSRIVLLGAKVCKAVGFDYVPFTTFKWIGVDRVTVTLPHPSGLNRTWNEPGAFKKAQDILRQVGVIP